MMLAPFWVCLLGRGLQVRFHLVVAESYIVEA